MTIEQKQCLLKYLGYYEGNVDGINGKMTEAAVQEFRQKNGMPALGDELDEVLVGAVFHGKFKSVEKPVENNGNLWEGIKYFDRSEFACKCGKCGGFPVEPNKLLVTVADRVREHFGKAIHVSSGVRCATHNARVGGVANSRHKSGKAMDFRVIGYNAQQVLAYVQKQPEIRYSYSIDGTYVHMDVE